MNQPAGPLAIRWSSSLQSIFVLLLALALLLGLEACYAVRASVTLSDLQGGIVYFVLALPNLVLLEALLVGLAGSMVGQAYSAISDHRQRSAPPTDDRRYSVRSRRQRAVQRGRRAVMARDSAGWWYGAMLGLLLVWGFMLALLVVAPGDVATAIDPTGTGYPVVVSFAGMPLVLAMLGLLCTSTRPARTASVERQRGSDGWREIVVALAEITLLLVGLLGLLGLLGTLVSSQGDLSAPPWSTSAGYLANQAIWQALQLVFIWAVGIVTLVDAAQRRRWGWLGLLVVPILVGMAWVGACGILMTWDVARLLPIPVSLYLGSLLAPVVATLLVALPALLYAWLSAPRAETA